MSQPEAAVSRGLDIRMEPLDEGSFMVQSAPRLRHRSGDGAWSQAVHSSDADYRDTNAWLNGLQDAPVAGGRLVDDVALDGVPMWQFLPSYVWPEVFWAVELVKALDALVEATGATELRPHVAGAPLDGVWQGVVREFAAARGLALEQPPATESAPVSRARRIARAAGLGRARERVLESAPATGARALAVASRGRGERPAGKRLLLASIPRHWTVDPHDPERRYDEQFGPLLDALREAGWSDFAGVECPYGSKVDALRSVAQRVRRDDTGVRWRSFDGYRAPRAAARRSSRPVFADHWQAVARDAADSDAARFRGVSLLRALAPAFERAFTHTLPECAAIRAGARAILGAERPAAIVASYETGPYQRALIVEGARIGIPAVGLMHGMIFDNHYDYMHVGTGTDPAAAFVVPARTCVWGPAWKRSLTESGSYPEAAVAVTGNWRYDDLPRRARTRPELRARIGVYGQERIVAVLGAAQETPAFVRASLEAVDAVGAVPRIRLHPSDDPAPVRRLLEEMGRPGETLVRGGTLADIVLASDAVAAQVSSAVGEAIMLDRPTVVVDLLRRGGWTQYADAGAVLTATSVAELGDQLRRALDDDETHAALAAARAASVADYFLALDGRSAERVAAALADAIEHAAPAPVAPGSAR